MIPAQTPLNSLPLAVSIGDPAGIGIDIILQIWVESLAKEKPTSVPHFLLICDPALLKRRAEQLGLTISCEIVEPNQQVPWKATKDRLSIIPLKNKLVGEPGTSNPMDADGIVESITRAVNLVQTERARAVVTLPINKKSLYDSGFDFPGHTEFLGSLANDWEEAERPVTPVMMLAGPELRAVPVTVHIPLKDVPSSLTSKNIIDTVRIAAKDLISRFAIQSPRIAISGLNPHAGEEGAMGSEDAEIIAPAISQLQSEGIDCFGPLPADTMFHASAREKYDLAVCMYHDQALIPAKALAFDETVNVTLGLPFVRTSPDHGTAYDLAGTGKANPASTLAALRMADEMSRPKHASDPLA